MLDSRKDQDRGPDELTEDVGAAQASGGEPEVAGEDETLAVEAAEETAPALTPEETRATVEALLYAAAEPLSLRDLRKALPEVSPEAVRTAVRELVETYRAPGRGLHIVEIAGGYQIATLPEYHERVSRLLSARPPSRLSIQALETLSAIAYRQPITVPELIELRGVRSAGVVRTLLEKKLIRIVGRKNVVGRPLLYGTTKEFLIRFGLKSLDELPQLEDMAEVFGDEATARLQELEERREESSAGTLDVEAASVEGEGEKDPDERSEGAEAGAAE